MEFRKALDGPMGEPAVSSGSVLLFWILALLDYGLPGSSISAMGKLPNIRCIFGPMISTFVLSGWIPAHFFNYELANEVTWIEVDGVLAKIDDLQGNYPIVPSVNCRGSEVND